MKIVQTLLIEALCNLKKIITISDLNILKKNNALCVCVYNVSSLKGNTYQDTNTNTTHFLASLLATVH